MHFSIYRFNTETDAMPYMQEFELTHLEAGEMNINGSNGLACITSVDSLKEPVDVCPKHLNPTEAIANIKKLMLEKMQ